MNGESATKKMKEIAEINPCWLCPDFKNGVCTQDNMIIKANRPCGTRLSLWLNEALKYNPLETNENKQKITY